MAAVSCPCSSRQPQLPAAIPGLFMRASLPSSRTSCAGVIAIGMMINDIEAGVGDDFERIALAAGGRLDGDDIRQAIALDIQSEHIENGVRRLDR